ncbi:hypothetical protein [Lactiplantibacillus modestisalitolerans]|uniref:Uncharacterized protein n=1 Tax=Lactiplantibacillus modestisalitolerans TaxID=1457219 RepID=A0ABV5WVZ1_9LACO|nr:hypothetical protein [Lactiplantibacillus modestisalitolerans]
MDNDTLKNYLTANSQVVTIFMEKATTFLNQKNEQRLAARQFNEAEINRQAEKMLDQVIANIHDKIAPTPAPKRPKHGKHS